MNRTRIKVRIPEKVLSLLLLFCIYFEDQTFFAPGAFILYNTLKNANFCIEKFLNTINYKFITINDKFTMAKAEKIRKEILKILFKDLLAEHSITSLAENLKITRMGAWKALKALESEKIVILTSIGKGKTSTYSIKLNWENPLLEKTISIILLGEAMNNPKWISNFAELEDKVSFLIIFGSILHNPKEAEDIDLIAVLDKSKFKKVDEIISKIQKTQAKKIHMIDMTKEEFKEELKKQNKAYFDALKKGIILFGQDNFIKFIRDFKK